MGKKRINVGLDELEEGMIVAKDIVDNGRVIVRDGLKLTSSIIEKLQRMIYLESLEIYQEISEYEEAKTYKENIINKKKILEFNKIEEEFNKLSENLKYTFDRMALGEDNTVLDDIREFTKKIKEEAKSHSLIIKNIVLHGSGTDVIYRHGVNVSALSALLGKWLGMNESQLNLLIYSAMLHDCGKTKIDHNLLYKPGRLTPDEYNKVKKHSEFGYEMVKKIKYIDNSVSYGVLMHHERVDGSGYPLGIKGDNIHEFGKIIAIADVFDAINSDRGYERKKAPFEALRIVKEEAIGKLDYGYVEVFLEHIVNYYLGEEVLLNNGDKCKILQMNINSIQRPLLLKDGEFIELTKHKELYIKEMLL